VCYSVVFMGRETGPLHLLAPNLLTGGKGADLVIRGNVVLNTLSARSTSTLLRDQICINSPSRRQVPGLAELSYATDFVPVCRTRNHGMKFLSGSAIYCSSRISSASQYACCPLDPAAARPPSSPSMQILHAAAGTLPGGVVAALVAGRLET
jgi:hypothetical protein